MWIKPKTDWVATDYINVADYNRIIGNIEHVSTMSRCFYPYFEIRMLDIKTVRDYLHADELNDIEFNLSLINTISVNLPIGESKSYYDNGSMVDYMELNRIETMTLRIYDELIDAYDDRGTLSLMLGGLNLW